MIFIDYYRSFIRFFIILIEITYARLPRHNMFFFITLLFKIWKFRYTDFLKKFITLYISYAFSQIIIKKLPNNCDISLYKQSSLSTHLLAMKPQRYDKLIQKVQKISEENEREGERKRGEGNGGNISCFGQDTTHLRRNKLWSYRNS